eukprot:TRINITY_DN3501_c0_g2_i3.p1 TRINITY_DN3501_c0_g2~~TRINITY_DN3501_c0_g2_i3.p1  ORF type:complete len:135 (-),score=21.14 TRINITY_DN3501_c0_g2_i3:290-694(-)
MSAAVQTFEFEGKEFTLWTEDQLHRINRDALTKRAMNIRDHIGADRLPQMPRQPEQMKLWILDVQTMLSGAGQPDRSERSEAAPPSAHGRGGGYGGDRTPGSVRQLNENEQAYSDASSAARAAKARNQGSNIFG